MGVWARQRSVLVAGLTWGCIVLAPATSRAQFREWAPEARGFGIFMGYNWGEPRGVEWGFEAVMSRPFQPQPRCSDEARAGFGPVLRVTMVGGSRLALTGAFHLGGESERSVLAFDGELGGTLAFGKDGLRAGIHSGALVESVVFNFYGRQDWLMSSYSMGGGFRYLPTFGPLDQCAG
ncbi:MAG: hypothetical protein EOO73_07080 [Myxococcales bacterium]|nr:MAG: hypothetical protein EOO73_07080 [Myxococcales bacterium]